VTNGGEVEGLVGLVAVFWCRSDDGEGDHVLAIVRGSVVLTLGRRRWAGMIRVFMVHG